MCHLWKHFKSYHAISGHIKEKHPEITKEGERPVKTYYDMFLKKEGEGVCKTCGKETSFTSISGGYNEFCSVQCISCNEEIKQKKAETCFGHYGVRTPLESEEVRETWRNNLIDKYGVENISQLEEVKEKKQKKAGERYGEGIINVFQAEEVKEKSKQTNLENLGVENPSQSAEIKAKKSETCMKNHGVPNPYKNKEIRKRGRKTFMKNVREGKSKIHVAQSWSYCCTYRLDGHDIYLRSSYEVIFALFLHFNNIPFEHETTYFEYNFNGKEHFYIPDFKIDNIFYETKGQMEGEYKGRVMTQLSAVRSSGYEINLVRYPVIQAMQDLFLNNFLNTKQLMNDLRSAKKAKEADPDNSERFSLIIDEDYISSLIFDPEYLSSLNL